MSAVGHSAKISGRVAVMLPVPVDGPLDYICADPVAVGSFVRVEMGRRTLVGVVWGEGLGDFDEKKLKSITEILDLPPLSDEHRDFINWVAAYTISPPGMVLKMTLSAPDAFGPPPSRTLYKKSGSTPEKLTAKRQACLDAIKDFKPRSVAAIAALGDVSDAVVRGLVKMGAFIPVEVEEVIHFPEPDAHLAGPVLNKEQQVASAALIKRVDEADFSCSLLEGVTGSGKTEVYFEMIARALQKSAGQVLVLVPEIALTSQWLDRFETRFGARPVEWHSDLGVNERRRAWLSILTGEARVVVGARSALFLPYHKLDLIVADEEHDPSFKQEDGVLYNARDMAVVRASLAKCPIALASATPSFETLVNAREGRYHHLTLTERHGVADLPAMIPIDMRHDGPPSGRWIAPALVSAIEEATARGEQSLLFLNRRGYAPLTLCRACGDRIDCPNCTAWLVEHKYSHDLQCHHCGFSMPMPKRCPSCEAEDSLVPVGPGVERLEEEVAAVFPTARRMVVTSDTITSPRKALEFVEKVESGQVDILIGTQILTKGYHFPMLTTVGVVDADLGLKGADLRAGERTFQQLSQVAGRAGREEREGKVYLQTYMPEHPVTVALMAHDVQAFRDYELASREAHHMPPFGRLVGIIVSGSDLRDVANAARALRRSAPEGEGIAVLGPAPAPLARLRGQHRHRLLLTARKGVRVQAVVENWIGGTALPKGVRVRADVDPQSFF